MEAMYAWVGQIMQGYTPAQVRRIAAQARTAALKAPIGATQQVGSSTEVAWIRYYPEIGPFPLWWRVGHIPRVPELGRNRRWDRHGGHSPRSTKPRR